VVASGIELESHSRDLGHWWACMLDRERGPPTALAQSKVHAARPSPQPCPVQLPHAAIGQPTRFRFRGASPRPREGAETGCARCVGAPVVYLNNHGNTTTTAVKLQSLIIRPND
jgi:hypothetical protein